MAALRGERLCASAALADGGVGLRFQVQIEQQVFPAFAIRHRGRVCAYLNRCAHQDVELDWMPGHFFDLGGRSLICALHGAHYDPHSGICTAGPCGGRALTPVPLVESQGEVFLATGADIHLHI